MRILSIIFSLIIFAHANANTCADLLNGGYFRTNSTGKILFGALGAAARAYPQDYVLNNLGLELDQVLKMSGRIVLVGEGYGQLLPLFVKAPKVIVTAVDPIYGLRPIPSGFMGDLLGKYISQFKPYLDSSSSTALPMKDRSVDRIYSHLLLNNFIEQKADANGKPIEDEYQYSQMAVTTLKDAIRVLKINGEAVFSGYFSKEEVEELMQQLSTSYGKTQPKYIWKVETFEVTTNYQTFGELAPDLTQMPAATHEVSRITITRK